MSSPKSKRAESSEVTVAKIDAKKAIVIAAVSLIAALATPLLTHHLSSKEEIANHTTIQEEIGFYKGRYSIIDQTLVDNLKIAKQFNDSLKASGDSEDPNARQKLESIKRLADNIQTHFEETKEQLEQLHRENVEALSRDDFIKASESRLKANKVIMETEAQTAEDQRRLAFIVTSKAGKVIAEEGAVNPTGNSPIPETPTGMFDLKKNEESTSSSQTEVGGVFRVVGVFQGCLEEARIFAVCNSIPLKPIPPYGGIQPYKSNVDQVATLADKREKIHGGFDAVHPSPDLNKNQE